MDSDNNISFEDYSKMIGDYAGAIADYVFHPNYEKGKWFVRVYINGKCYEKVTNGANNAKAWLNYLSRHVPGAYFEHGRLGKIEDL